MTTFGLIIFDCDGVLVDSERITNTVFACMLNELGLSVTLADMFRQFVGLSMEQCLAKIELMLGAKPPAGFEADYRRRSQLALETELQAIPSVPSILPSLSLPYCVASNGGYDKMRYTLGLTGLLHHFEDRMFSAQDVAAPKPAPDVFLLAAHKLEVEPNRCLVIEDTPTGVKAGIAAGMTVWGYSGLTPENSLLEAGASRVFSDMGVLPSLLG